jgi:hypothetical protein
MSQNAGFLGGAVLAPTAAGGKVIFMPPRCLFCVLIRQ